MNRFDELLSHIPQIGLDHHREEILENSRCNAQFVERTIRDIAPTDKPCLVISAGPSLYRKQILRRIGDSFSDGIIIATDGAYIQCLKAGITPDWVVTIDPHPTRIVRWFGDPDYERNSEGDDYFKRQDLDVNFRANDARENAKNIESVDAAKAKLVICSTAPANVVARTAHFERFWFAPLVDSPDEEGITKTICAESGLPALNTGGTVGTAAWAFARTCLQSREIAVVGMDFGYYPDTPLSNTQEWNMLKYHSDVRDFYPYHEGHWGAAYTSPTYWWYRQNFLDLLKAADARVTNCSEGGLLFGERVDCMDLDEWLKSCS